MNKKSLTNSDDAGREEDGRIQFFPGELVNNSRSMISIINKDYKYEKVNTTFCKAHKSDESSFLGRSLEDVWGQEIFLNKIKPNIDLCLKGKIVRYKASFNTPKSGKSHYEVVFRPMQFRKGKVTHLVAETFDISAIKRSEKRADEARKKLLRIESDYQKRLLQAQRLETIGVFAGGIAHDFNNILTTIEGYATLLCDDLPEGSGSLHKTRKILSAVDKAKTLTSQILLFSRQADTEKRPVKVYDVLVESVGFIRSVIPSGIVIDADLPVLNIYVYADPLQLFRIFYNLMTNAVQSMENKGGTLSVNMSEAGCDLMKKRIRQDNITDDYVKISIADTGKGIAPDIIDRIFEPFFTTREVGKGSGLGLSVVHGLVTDLGGEVFVSSKEQKGSAFEVFLPAFPQNFK